MAATRCLRHALAGAFALVLLAGLAGGAGAAGPLTPEPARSSATRPSTAPPGAQTPAPPPGAAAAAGVPTAAAGLCQCISDHNERRTSCLASPAVCQSACGSSRYSFVPYASLTCPAGGQPASQ